MKNFISVSLCQAVLNYMRVCRYLMVAWRVLVALRMAYFYTEKRGDLAACFLLGLVVARLFFS